MSDYKGSEKQIAFATDLLSRLETVATIAEQQGEKDLFNYCDGLLTEYSKENRTWKIIDALIFIRGKNAGAWYECVERMREDEMHEIING